MELQLRQHKEMSCLVRAGSSDESAFKEVIVQHNYEKLGFKISTGEFWLDLGANIGTFAIYASKMHNCRVICFEPEPENFSILEKNIQLNKLDKKVDCLQCAVIAGKENNLTLYTGNLPKNKWRHTLVKPKRGGEITVDCLNFKEVVLDLKPTAIKMDIEGAEFAILSKYMDTLKLVNKFVFEYHFDFDRQMKIFFDFRKALQKIFKVVKHKTILENVEMYNYFPSGITIYCYNE